MTDVDHALAVASLLRDPERARVYTGLFVDGPLTDDELADRIDDFSEGRVREVLSEMADSGLVTETGGEYDADPVTAQIAGYEVTPEVIAVVSASEIHSDLRRVREEHGVDGVIRSVDGVADYLSEDVTWRMAVDDTPATDAEMWAIEGVVVDVRG
ncbi:hypothetical protein [Halorubrum sp. GN11GM_10-3_MGM]|uniref:hypothetical protein n=1 Tax=Halorubrum sp. GN11GM_10-3_MGM TaxID=2518111 RepID=UPI0010F89A54|nr:hypothetical protein [Halorubrum sp. GN11GM_10-3_MGM]TKX72171.1 hypothetical protein EXE40_04835 [Halorubrum sp. GN11GM_10-3_MGM]